MFGLLCALRVYSMAKLRCPRCIRLFPSHLLGFSLNVTPFQEAFLDCPIQTEASPEPLFSISAPVGFSYLIYHNVQLFISSFTCFSTYRMNFMRARIRPVWSILASPMICIT